MLDMLTVLFWLAVAAIGYAFAGFPVLLLVRAWLFRRPVAAANGTPSVSVVVAAYNEADTIRARLDDLFAQDYPAERIEVLVASDGSTDGTVDAAAGQGDERVRVLDLPRCGKGAALDEAVQHATGDVLVFTDANTVFAKDALRRLVAPFADTGVGGVAGNQVYLRDGTPSPTADGERAYWSYDRSLKAWQSRAGSVTSATGAIYAVRRSLYTPVPPGAMDDFVISAGVVAQGRRLVFAPDALAYEPVATREGIEFSRKVRIVAQGLAAVSFHRGLLNPFRHGFYAVQLFTHKVLRRLLFVPAVVLLVTSPLLWQAGFVYRAASVAQIVFYTAALIGGRTKRRRFARLLLVPHYACTVYVAAAMAVGRLLFGRGVPRWEPERHTPLEAPPAAKGAAR